VKDSSKLWRVVKVLLVDTKIQQVMEESDELDKSAITLYGFSDQSASNFKSGIGQGSKVVSVDRNCFNCSPQPNLVLKAFKMACLNYKPSDILWNNKEYSRMQILKLRKMMVEGLDNENTGWWDTNLALPVISSMLEGDQSSDIRKIFSSDIKNNKELVRR
jgi:hypothetical protein